MQPLNQSTHPDHQKYIQFTSKSQLDRSINSLLGLIEGIVVDQEINESELNFLRMWLDDYEVLKEFHPYNEIIPLLNSAIADSILTADERADIEWLCERLCSTEYYDRVTADMQRLHALLGGVAADEIISESELRGIATWLDNHDHLKTCWPYDEIESVIVSVLQDGKIDDQDHAFLLNFFREFTAILDDRTVTNPIVQVDGTVFGVCAVCPDIDFDKKHSFLRVLQRDTLDPHFQTS